MKCPKCNLEINENIMSCPMCQADPLEPQQDENIEQETQFVETTLLMTANDEIQANIVESLLKVYGIPLTRKYKGNDTYGKIVLGMTIHGIDLFVPKSAYEEAMDVIKNELPAEEEPKLEESHETEEELEALKNKYDQKRRSRAWIALLFFVPGILILAGTALYWIIKLLF